MEKEPGRENNTLEIKLSDNTSDILAQVIEFLQLFLPAALAKRLNYHTRQQIADMIQEKYHVRMSRSSVGRF